MWVYIYVGAQLIVSAACCWAILSPRINDGLWGKAALILMLFASLGCVAWAIHWPWEIQRPSALFSVAVAAMAVRCYWLKIWAPSMRRQIKRRIRKCR